MIKGPRNGRDKGTYQPSNEEAKKGVFAGKSNAEMYSQFGKKMTHHMRQQQSVLMELSQELLFLLWRKKWKQCNILRRKISPRKGRESQPFNQNGRYVKHDIEGYDIKIIDSRFPKYSVFKREMAWKEVNYTNIDPTRTMLWIII